jgi:glycosyltransferase involved in cell wall biosynthesis
MRPKVCVFTSAHPPFDVRIFHKECVSLVNAGCDVILIAPHHESTEVKGVSIQAVPRVRSRIKRMLLTTWIVFRRARVLDAAVYHFHDPELIPVGLLLRATGKEVIYDIHEDLPRTLSYKPYIPRWLQKPLAKLIDILETFAARFFSHLIAATADIASRFRSNNCAVSVVQNYPLLSEFHVSGAQTESKVSEKCVTYVGLRITEARGACEIVSAMGLLPAGLDARLKLAGSIDPPELIVKLSTIPGWEKIDYLGFLGRDGVAGVLDDAAMGLVVLHPEPNYVNSQPVKLFEYMCAGIPVIASDFPAFRSIVDGARCGLLVNPLDPREIAAAIEYLWTRPEEARAMGARGRCAVECRYNWAHEERTLLTVYDQVCKPSISQSKVKAEAT